MCESTDTELLRFMILGEVLRMRRWAITRRTPLLTSELVTIFEVEVRQGHVLQGNDVACSERYSEG